MPKTAGDVLFKPPHNIIKEAVQDHRYASQLHGLWKMASHAILSFRSAEMGFYTIAKASK